MSSRKGFTLVEVISVTIIIATLALLIVPSFKNSALTNQMEKAKVGLMELTLAVQLYNEDHLTPISGVLNTTQFTALTTLDPNYGYRYIDKPQRWGLRPGSVAEYSLNDANGVALNCKYKIGGSDSILTQTTCKFNKVDAQGFECYRFYVENVNPALIKKERSTNCDEL